VYPWTNEENWFKTAISAVVDPGVVASCEFSGSYSSDFSWPLPDDRFGDTYGVRELVPEEMRIFLDRIESGSKEYRDAIHKLHEEKEKEKLRREFEEMGLVAVA
jgi:hypothetical protein